MRNQTDFLKSGLGEYLHSKRCSRLLQIGLAAEDLLYGSFYSSACQNNLNQQLSQDELHNENILRQNYHSFTAINMPYSTVVFLINSKAVSEVLKFKHRSSGLPR